MTVHLTTTDLAARWDKTPEWVTKKARDGEIPGAWKLSKHWRFGMK